MRIGQQLVLFDATFTFTKDDADNAKPKATSNASRAESRFMGGHHLSRKRHARAFPRVPFHGILY